MRGLAREALPGVIAGLTVAFILGAVGVLGDFVGLRSSENEAVLRYTMSGGLFVILAAATGFVIFRKRSSLIDSSVKQHQFGYRHRVLAIAFGVLELASLVWFLWPRGLPPLTASDCLVSRIVEFSIDSSPPLEPGQRLVTGEAYIGDRADGQKFDQDVLIPAHRTVIASIQLINQSRYIHYLKQDDAFLTLVLSGKDENRLWFSDNQVRFRTGALRSNHFQIKIRQ